jgi:hypothetical protein
MECLEPEEHPGEDVTAENVGYCELYPECCETKPEEHRPGWLARLLRRILGKSSE